MVDVKDWFTSVKDGVYKFKWRLAQVIQVDSTDKRRVRISYEGWGSAFDEWIDVTEPDRDGGRRVAECGKHTVGDSSAPLSLLVRPRLRPGSSSRNETT